MQREVEWRVSLPAGAEWRVEPLFAKARRRVFSEAFAGEPSALHMRDAADAFVVDRVGSAAPDGSAAVQVAFAPLKPGVHWLPLTVHWRATKFDEWREEGPFALVGVCFDRKRRAEPTD